jgi:hypothetical protein
MAARSSTVAGRMHTMFVFSFSVFLLFSVWFLVSERQYATTNKK